MAAPRFVRSYAADVARAGRAVVATPTGYAVVGHRQQDVRLFQFDANGAFRSEDRLGATVDTNVRMHAFRNGAGEFLVFGESTVEGLSYVWFRKVSAAGQVTVRREYVGQSAGAYGARKLHAVQAVNGRYWLIGAAVPRGAQSRRAWIGVVDGDGTLVGQTDFRLPEPYLAFDAVAAAPDGEGIVAVVSTTPLYPEARPTGDTSDRAAYVVRLSGFRGDVSSYRRLDADRGASRAVIGAIGRDGALVAAVDTDVPLYDGRGNRTGYTRKNIRLYRFDRSGGVADHALLNAGDTELNLHAIATTADGGFALTGRRGTDLWVARVADNLLPLRSASFGSGTGLGVFETEDGDFLVTGGWNGSTLALLRVNADIENQ